MVAADAHYPVGKISKQWTGFAREMFTDADNFGVTCKENTFLFNIHLF